MNLVQFLVFGISFPAEHQVGNDLCIPDLDHQRINSLETVNILYVNSYMRFGKGFLELSACNNGYLRGSNVYLLTQQGGECGCRTSEGDIADLSQCILFKRC